MSQHTYAFVLAELFRKRTAEYVSPKIPVRDVWADILRVEANSDSYFELLRGVQRVYARLMEQIEHPDIPASAKQVHRKYLKQIGSLLDVGNFGAHWRDIASNHLTERHIETLDLLNANLIGRAEAIHLDDTDKIDLESDVEAILGDLPNAGLPDEVASIVTQHLKYVLFVLRNFDILGAEQLRAAFSLILGDALCEFVYSKKSESSKNNGPAKNGGIVQKLVALAGKGFNTVNKAAQTGRSLEYLHQVIGLIGQAASESAS